MQRPEQIIGYIEKSSQHAQIIDVSLGKSIAHKTATICETIDLDAAQAFLKLEASSRVGEGLVKVISDATDIGRWVAFYCSRLFGNAKSVKK